MARRKIILTITLSLFLLNSKAQLKETKWNNKDKGTVNISYNAIGYYPDTTETGISSKSLIGIGVRLFELSESGCKKIEGKIKINGKEYFAYDSAGKADDDGYKYPDDYLGIWLSEGEYSITAFCNNDYYPVKTEKYFLAHGLSYQFDFYLIRKDEQKTK